MSIFSNPRILYFTRIFQLSIGLGFLVTISYAGTHRGWYDNITGKIVVGGNPPHHITPSKTPPLTPSPVIAFLFTLALTLQSLVLSHMKSNPFSGGSRTRTIIRLVAEIIVCLLWIATVAELLRKRDGCGARGKIDRNMCFKNAEAPGTSGHPYQDHPEITWDVSIAFSFVEM